MFIILDGQNGKTWIVGMCAQFLESFSVWQRPLTHNIRLHPPPLPSRSGHCLHLFLHLSLPA